MKRIIIHWTGGPHKPTGLDKEHYHLILDGSGELHSGLHPVRANAGPLKPGAYAAHTLNCNTGSIGVALAAMAGAQERPFKPGSAPITAAQEAALTHLLVALCDQYQIPVTRETVLTHAEVQPTLGIAQRGKWDITWLPGMTQPGDPLAVGDLIRERVRTARRTTAAPAAATQPGWLARIVEIISNLLWRSK
ncbi:peptidoglycan recognition protein family protein [Pseudogemmobacter humi]|uniref:N-acetylmuramoyl-L-alanine amidase n=1 Tax=Pseudogemmobacter humi TaxID=2483812 RepID=A0A3P5XU27_9RHOB|nr:N-acetylmuramoyl-L-alanine amidase [Pseudogemmobacter humi]VDC31540.1 N-acetylmuramoyl-L-alanine amidase [Pseudogemmobacter humi]